MRYKVHIIPALAAAIGKVDGVEPAGLGMLEVTEDGARQLLQALDDESDWHSERSGEAAKWRYVARGAYNNVLDALQQQGWTYYTAKNHTV